MNDNCDSCENVISVFDMCDSCGNTFCADCINQPNSINSENKNLYCPGCMSSLRKSYERKQTEEADESSSSCHICIMDVDNKDIIKCHKCKKLTCSIHTLLCDDFMPEDDMGYCQHCMLEMMKALPKCRCKRPAMIKSNGQDYCYFHFVDDTYDDVPEDARSLMAFTCSCDIMHDYKTKTYVDCKDISCWRSHATRMKKVRDVYLSIKNT